MKKISIVIPCYNEEEAIPYYYDVMQAVVKKMSKKSTFEFIFVNDGSTDNTLGELRALAKKDKSVRYISFSRNFGKEAGIYAGLEASTGDYITTMDVDLQDPPELLEEMYLGITTEGYDCVATRRKNRTGEPIIRSFFARLFYYLIRRLSGLKRMSGPPAANGSSPF